MENNERTQSGYTIIESCVIGSNELVIGHNPKAVLPYVCWYCKNGSDYFWGKYADTIDEARDALNERYQRECRLQKLIYNNRQKCGEARERE